MIKIILYTRNVDEVEDIIDEMRSHDHLELYPNAAIYFENVFDLKDAWSLARRSYFMVRISYEQLCRVTVSGYKIS